MHVVMKLLPPTTQEEWERAILVLKAAIRRLRAAPR